MVSRGCVVGRGDSMHHGRGMMDSRGVVDDGGMMDDGGMVDGGCVVGSRARVSRSISSTLVLDISNISTIVVGVVLDMLGPAIRKEDRVGSLYITRTIGHLSSIEVGSRILVVHSILVAVGFGLLLVDRCRGVVRSRSVMSNRGVVNNRGMVDCRSMVGGRCVVRSRCMIGGRCMVCSLRSSQATSNSRQNQRGNLQQ